MTMDLLPTYAELSETSNPQGIDGVSLVPALFGRDAFPNRDLFHFTLPLNVISRYNILHKLS